MEQATALFNAIYSRFILRDLFGKVVPGTAVVLALASYFNFLVECDCLTQLSFWNWLVLVGFAWIVGFSVQSIGEFFLGKLSWGYRYFPKWVEGDGKKVELTLEGWYDIYFGQFQKEGVLKETEQRQDERLVVIKEACGNGFVATFLVLILHWFQLRAVSFDPASIILIILFLALWRMHIQHVNRQFKVIQAFLKARAGQS